ncbi:Major Facilitator Superfamily protein [Gimesia panareensis]|uniref:Major Facilitator Superfamily protein n=2 Tax=Gimesia panareensis TaxID=2527978 RepID=A0A518FLH6_9PLAN|nr:Major Facilitator Superfamily protein [Gimesia panareensis]
MFCELSNATWGRFPFTWQTGRITHMQSYPPQLPEPATRTPLSLRKGCVLYSLFFGASITEAVSVNLIPLTLALFTRDPNIIFWILAINPALGFIVQPIFGLISDRIWTKLGRRALFLVCSPPIIAVSLLLIPFIGTLGIMVVVIVFLQFFQDVINGTDQPLIADLVPPPQRTTVLGAVKAAENLGIILVLFLGMPLVEWYREQFGYAHYGLPLYVFAALCQILFVSGAALFLQEQKRPDSVTNNSRISIRNYLGDFFAQPMLFRIALAYFFRSFSRSAVTGSIALYTLHTLQLSEREFGISWGLMPFISLLAGVPLGLAAERFAKDRVLQFAFGILIISCGVGYFGHGVTGLIIASLIFGIADMLLEVTLKAFMSEHYPADRTGQLAGAVNCFFAAGRVAGLLAVGYCVKLMNPQLDWSRISETAYVDYSVIWMISSFGAVLGMIALSTTKDLRFELELKNAMSVEQTENS